MTYDNPNLGPCAIKGKRRYIGSSLQSFSIDVTPGTHTYMTIGYANGVDLQNRFQYRNTASNSR